MWWFPTSSLSSEPSSLQRFKSSVYRRYNDFVVFHEMLLQKFPYRMVPALPPKRMLGGSWVCWRLGRVEEGVPLGAEGLAPGSASSSSGPLPSRRGWQQGIQPRVTLGAAVA